MKNIFLVVVALVALPSLAQSSYECEAKLKPGRLSASTEKEASVKLVGSFNDGDRHGGTKKYVFKDDLVSTLTEGENVQEFRFGPTSGSASEKTISIEARGGQNGETVKFRYFGPNQANNDVEVSYRVAGGRTVTWISTSDADVSCKWISADGN